MKAGALIPHGSDYTTTSYLVNLIFLIKLRVFPKIPLRIPARSARTSYIVHRPS